MKFSLHHSVFKTSNASHVTPSKRATPVQQSGVAMPGKISAGIFNLIRVRYQMK